MNGVFEVAGGSVVGSRHVRTGRNNQDAYHYLNLESSTIAVVCDGCGSAAYSEVGAALGARLTAKTIYQLLNTLQRHEGTTIHWHSATFCERVRQELLIQLQQLIDLFGGDRLQVIHDYLLFTVLGVLITPTKTIVFGMGDGAIAINDHVISLPTFPNNAPPYLAYGLLPPTLIDLPPDQLRFQIYQELPTDRVQSILIGSDGVVDLMHLAEHLVPGQTEAIGELSQFWKCDRYFHHPDDIHRQLTLINRSVVKPDWNQHQLRREGELLPDDTTLVVVRRKKGLDFVP